METEQMKLRHEIVSAYVESLNTLSVEPIIELLHTEFMFKWIDNEGVRSELRYLGYLSKAFSQMKREGKSVNAELIWLHMEGYRFPI